MSHSTLKNIIVSEDIHPDGMALLRAQEHFVVSTMGGDRDQLIAAMPKAHAILVRTLLLNEPELASATELQIVSRHGVGCDNIDVAHLSSRNIPMAIAADANSTSVVEHVLMMMLALNKKALPYDQFTRNNGFNQRSLHHTSELLGKKILIVGFGRIGRRLAPICKAIGMRVTVADIALDHEYANSIGVQGVVDFHDTLEDCDYLSVHVPLNSTTHHLISEAELSALPSHAIVINCARGGIVNESALAHAINSGTIAAAGIDVFEVEPPPPDNPLLELPNSIMTPHNAASTEEGLRRMATFAAQNIIDCFRGELKRNMIFNLAELSGDFKD